MSDEHPAGEANWSLLPHRPIEFFGLQPGFDRSDLKRAYNKLLRIYKPDKFPHEFQRLRAAYEQLDTALRYGSPQTNLDPGLSPMWLSPNDIRLPADSPEPPPTDRSPAATPTGPTPQSAPTPPVPTPRERLLARLDETSPADLYLELKSQTPTTPLDYYALAVLSDAVHDAQDNEFVKWLLAGLRKHPDEPTLVRFLVAYLQSDQLADDALVGTLLEMSQVITTDRFYFFAEPLFDRLSQAVTWDKFEQVLQACRQNINDHHVRGRVVFSCHLLRRAAWLAPPDKVDALVNFIEVHSQYLGSGLEYDYEFNIRLIEYTTHRDQFIQRGPLCRMIDEALRGYCLQPGGTSDLKIVACQTQIAQQPELLFNEFPFPASDEDVFMGPWIWTCEEVLGRLETQPEPTASEQMRFVTLKLLQQIDVTFPVSTLQFFNISRWILYGFIYLLIVMIPLFPTAFVVMHLPRGMQDHGGYLMAIVPIVLVILFHRLVKPHTLDVWTGKYLFRMVCRHYNRWWRSMIARFHAATHLSYYEVRQSASELIQYPNNELNVSTWFPQLYGADIAMVLYATALRFLR